MHLSDEKRDYRVGEKELIKALEEIVEHLAETHPEIDFSVARAPAGYYYLFPVWSLKEADGEGG